MKIKIGVFALLIVTSIWLVFGGYRYVPFLKGFGVESYDIKESVAIAQTATTTDQSATTTPLITHIPTPKNVKAIYMSSWVAGTPTINTNVQLLRIAS
jgi:hypothetical protein